MRKRELDFSKIKENGVIRREILNLWRKGKMPVVHVIGLPGTGKSWYCLRLAEQLNEDLKNRATITSKNVVTGLLGLLKFIRGVRSPGQIVICEEIGVWLGSRRAMSAENVDAGYVWDTLRKKRIIVIGNNPISKDIDKKLLSLSTMQVQTLTLNKTLGICIVKPLRLQTNPDTAKTYRHRLKENGYDVHRCWSGRPSKELTDAYEQGKDEFLDDLYKRLEAKHQKKLDKEIEKVGGKIGLITPIESRRAKMKSKGMTNLEIAKVEGKSEEAIRMALIRYQDKISKIQNLENPQVVNEARP